MLQAMREQTYKADSMSIIYHDYIYTTLRALGTCSHVGGVAGHARYMLKSCASSPTNSARMRSRAHSHMLNARAHSAFWSASAYTFTHRAPPLWDPLGTRRIRRLLHTIKKASRFIQIRVRAAVTETRTWLSSLHGPLHLIG